MPRNNKGTAKLKKIIAEAKRLKPRHPGMKWTSLVKMASKRV